VLAICVALLNPRRAIIGGGLGLAAFDFLAPSAAEELKLRVLPENIGELEILPSTQTSSAVGAAALAWYFQQSVAD
jgi:predicted NBD/HSP70 family sugar kinase